MFGWKGKLLRIDLSTHLIRTEALPPRLMKEYIGGRGMCARILFDEIDPRIDALSPDNKLIFAPGPLTGTGAPAASRYIVSAKSPLSNCVSSPCCGGYLAANLKYSGYDLVIFEGRSPEPVYASICDDRVELRPARHLWGKTSHDTEEAIRAEMKSGDGLDNWALNAMGIANIGPAGENLVRFASIMADGGRAAGRSGLGAVMGSKNLKAIVSLGKGHVNIADVEGFRKAVMAFYQEGRDNGELRKRRRYGTWSLPGRANASKSQATYNFKEGYSEAFAKYEDPEVIRDLIRVRDEACFACPFSCGKRSRIKDTDYPLTAKGPEHETMALLGSNCGLEYMEDICRANYICNELGMDTITAGAMISLAMELFEEGHLPEREIGYPLPFGSTNMLRLLNEIALRQGIGDLMAEGGVAFASRYGHPELFMGVKGMGIPAWHPQAFDALGLQYATSNTGGSHTKSTMPFYEGRKDPARFVEFTKKDQDYISAADSGVLCWIIYHGPLWGEKLAEWLTYVTGVEHTVQGMDIVGERIWNLERLFNLRAGLTGKDDCLPPRITREPRVKNRVVQLDRLLDEYYASRGWDSSGVPTREKLQELGLEEEGAYVL
ncbi:MAG TPA: aldehyde ferredoxin oxidoreductase family protein [Syntrophorhabdales bacterium]|nr:aldehyde ferredoxin oxidoreductase family protein [Syntrophorhabdales bacterium]